MTLEYDDYQDDRNDYNKNYVNFFNSKLQQIFLLPSF